MKTIRNASFLIIFTIIASACTVEQKSQSWQQIEYSDGGDITLKYVASEGFAYHDNNDELTGVTTEIFRDFVHWVESEYEVLLTVHYEPYESWSDFYEDVRDAHSGTFGMGNVTITPERWEELDFSPAYMTNIAVLITHEDTPELTQLSEMGEHFAHLNALAFEGTLHEERLKNFKEVHFGDMTMEYAHSNNEIIERVAENDRFFAYVDVYNFWRAKDAGMPIRQHHVGDEPSEQFGFIMPSDSDWESIMFRFFEADGGYLNSERYQNIMQTHLGTGLATMLDEARRSLD